MKLKHENPLNTTFEQSFDKKEYTRLNKFDIHTMLTKNDQDPKLI